MRCPSCGIQNPKAKTFCANCGAAMLIGGQPPRLGPYLLEAKLGEGGMGVVYRATDEKLKREVAVKVLHPHLLKHEHLMDRFRREARMHAKIIHPNIVTLLSLYEDGEHMALVMEMVHGRNLKEYLREHPRLRLLEIIRISESILSGLEAAHKLGMVHRDLKPANVLLANDGTVKLMDFGLAKPKHGEEDITESGATVGSFRYMAPEQILNQAVDARTDLYALGILLYQMCTSKLPFDTTASGGGEYEIMEKQVRQEPTPPHDINSSMPHAMSELIMALLAKNPSDRPATCEAVHKVLVTIAKQFERPQAKITMPKATGEQLDSKEIAKGLLRSYGRRMWRVLCVPFQALKRVSIDKPLQAAKSKVSTTRASERLRKPLILGLLLILAASLTGIVYLAKTSQGPEAPKQKPPLVKKAPAKATPATQPKKKVSTKPRKKPVAKPRPKKRVASKPKASKPVAKPSARRSVTYRVPHKLLRNDNTKAGSRDRHEFRGGKRVYFKGLAKKRVVFGKTIRSFKKGWARLYFEKPVKLSSIVVHRASVGRLDFRGGEIQLELQDKRGRWHTILARKNRDIDARLMLSKPRSAFAEVKGIRLRFKTPEPITIGPIDLIP